MVGLGRLVYIIRVFLFLSGCTDVTVGGPCAQLGTGAFLGGPQPTNKIHSSPTLPTCVPSALSQACASVCRDRGLGASGCALHLASGTLPFPFHSFQAKCLMRMCGEVIEGGLLEMQIRGPRLRADGSQGITWSTMFHAGWSCGVSDKLEHQIPCCPSCGVSDSCVGRGGAAASRHWGMGSKPSASPCPPSGTQSILCPQHCHQPGPLPGTVSSPPAEWAGRLPIAVTSLGTLSLGTHI